MVCVLGGELLLQSRFRRQGSLGDFVPRAAMDPIVMRVWVAFALLFLGLVGFLRGGKAVGD
jgi:hypothetical protein